MRHNIRALYTQSLSIAEYSLYSATQTNWNNNNNHHINRIKNRKLWCIHHQIIKSNSRWVLNVYASPVPSSSSSLHDVNPITEKGFYVFNKSQNISRHKISIIFRFPNWLAAHFVCYVIVIDQNSSVSTKFVLFRSMKLRLSKKKNCENKKLKPPDHIRTFFAKN